ncbi:hypothetical protein MCETHM1_01966 [Flavobacteriaceae bacterium]
MFYTKCQIYDYKITITMKNLFFLLIAIALLTSCDKDGQIFAGNDQLPPETQTGAYTVGCLVNSKVFLPHD